MSASPSPSPFPYEAALATPAGRAKDLVRSALSVTAAPFGTLLRVATRQPAVALTFDDGPEPGGTTRTVELLEAHGARGTFFMVGEAAARHPDLVERVARGRHAIANHSWDHPSFRRIDDLERHEQLARTAAALAPHAAPLFRPPFGEQSVASLRAVRQAGYACVAWDVVAEDWTDGPAEHLVERVMRRLRRGSIVVFHDALYVTEEPRYRDRGAMLAALGILLRRLAPAVRLVTVPELLALGRPVWGHHYHRLPQAFHDRLSGASASG
jgi:peptidoglycan/xylan/chitin deacetylase (PgdA/CDA1 family)